MKNFLKKYKFDILIISILSIISLITVISFSCLSNKENQIASIYVSNKLIEEIDLSKEDENYRYLIINGKNGEIEVAIKKNEIKVINSSCLNKTCIKEGKATNLKPIICAYNELIIEIKGQKNVDVELG